MNANEHSLPAAPGPVSRPARPMPRRDFLRSAVSVCLLPLAARSAPESPPAPKVRFGLITDVHYADTPDRGRRRYRASIEKMRRAVEAMNREKPAFVVELGDFKDQDQPADAQRTLAHLRAIETEFRRFVGPVHHVLGNHDVDSITKEQFLAEVHNGGAPAKAAQYSFDAGGVHFVVLDANFSADGSAYQPGRFKWDDSNIPPAGLEWLRADLARATGPAIVFAHQRLDTKGPVAVQNAAAVREVLEKSGRVQGVIQGHDHAGAFQRINGIAYYTLKSTVESAADASPWAIAELDHGKLTVRGEIVVTGESP